MTQSEQVSAALDPAVNTLLAADAAKGRLLLVVDVKSYAVVHANELFCTTAGRPGKAVIGTSVLELLSVVPRPGESLGNLEGGIAQTQRGTTVKLPLLLSTAAGARALSATLIPLATGTAKSDRMVIVGDDVTEAERLLTEARGISAAVDRSQAVIKFDLTGTVLAANQNFLDTMGYQAAEVLGKHHRMFCEPDYVATEAYAAFWATLGSGQVESGEYMRLAKGGRHVWLQATYNPILDVDGTVVKVVKFASDVTEAKQRTMEYLAKVNAVDRAQAVIEFGLDGRVITANANFLAVMGYSLKEVAGKHHRMFCEPELVASHDYGDFWNRLGAGEFESGEYKRIAKGGKEVWLQATYNPILDPSGQVIKIVKFASDVSEAKLRNAEFIGKVNAVDRAQAVIEFNLDGTIVTANDNFLATMGYSLADIIGKHHRIFCDPVYTATDAYTTFWDKLAAGAFESGEYKRVTKGGEDIWLQATYNPILDVDGKVVKVVKFASDVTQTKVAGAEVAGKLAAVERVQAVIEFDLDGLVLTANDNFSRAFGYSLREVVGQHHSTFCSEDYVRSEEYRDFWMRLGKGDFITGRFHRIGKFGRNVHIQAAYNPILNLAGEVTKVVKYAYDITAQVEREQHISSRTHDMTTSLQALSGSIGDIARNSTMASDLGQETHTNAEQGVEALRASLEAIAMIQRSSTSIAEIVRVMGEIASQTNLLAFNASIEAARAGEHGVGFSIVAGEVRKLAERSSEAAQQISKLIDESAERVSKGSEISKRAEEAFQRIVASVGKTNEAIRTISDSTRTQQEASTTVNALFGEISSVHAS